VNNRPKQRILEVGVGTGLSLAYYRKDSQITGIDVSPEMLEIARKRVARQGLTNVEALHEMDAENLAFPDGSFDLVASTLSLHHWADPTAGLAEIGRVLRPGGRALVWDFRPGVRPHPFGPRHAHIPDAVDHTHGSQLRVVSATPRRWPWRFTLTQRIELVRADDAPGHPEDKNAGQELQFRTT
jgi:ubiquinone/menaquinone biosynthesis C-methylase UbiE